MQVSGAGALLAPFLTVTFAGVFTGDVLTSMVRPLQDGAMTVCYVATGAFNVGRGHRYFEGGAHGECFTTTDSSRKRRIIYNGSYCTVIYNISCESFSQFDSPPP